MSDFYFNDVRLKFGTPSTRFDANLEAIKLSKKLLAEKVDASTKEQGVLSQYIGWGDTRLGRNIERLTDVVTEEELRLIKASSLNAHYTSQVVIEAMWGALQNLGIFEHKIRALDPSAGVGHFKSMTPVELREKIEWTEIELDNITAGILKLLHPNSRIHNMGFEEVNLPDGMFDLAISNVPFGNYGVYSRRNIPKVMKHSIHDFFLANTWYLLKPGGVMAYITSRFTMDKKDMIARNWLAKRFNLISAVRLPQTAFTENAGTEVITDILIMQKRHKEVDDIAPWQMTEKFSVGYRSANVNSYFINYPEQIMGEPNMNGTMYNGKDGYNVELEFPIRLSGMLERVYQDLLPLEKPVSVDAGDVSEVEVIMPEMAEASPVVVALMDIYKTAKQLIHAEVSGSEEVSSFRAMLNNQYDVFVSEFGTIANNAKRVKGAEAFFLRALEKENGKKADIFTRSITRKARTVDMVTPGDALLLCLDSVGSVDLNWIATRLQISESQVIEDLRGEIFLEPASQAWQTASQYLSGNIRIKLREAQASAGYDDRFNVNVSALEAVIPPLIAPGDIRVPLGASWVPSKYMKAFVEELLNDSSRYVTATFKVDYIPALAEWTMSSDNTYRIDKSALTVKWGTSAMNAIKIIECGLNSKTPQVWEGENDERVINIKETAAAQQKLQEIKEEFEKWLWKDEARTNDLTTIYNEEFNSVRNVAFNGSHLSTPGLAETISLRTSQKDVAWRIVQSPAVGVMHEVGMGKTLSAIVGAMESKRLGFTKKAMIVVPNHTLYGEDSWSTKLLEAYPGANILIPEPSDMSKANRPKFLASIATNDWDVILIPFSSFKLLPVSSERISDFYETQKIELEEALAAAESENNRTSAKQIQKALKRLEVKLKTLSEFKKDDEKTVTWEEMGVDMLIIDEFHCLPYESKVTTNLGEIQIGEIVEKKLNVLVKSVDLSTNEVKWMPVTDWFENPQASPMVRVDHELGAFECTANHKVWTKEEGYVEAGKLTSKHTIKCSKNSSKDLRGVPERVSLPVYEQENKREEKVLLKLLCGNLEDEAAGATRLSTSNVGSLAESIKGKTESYCVSSNESKQPKSNSGMEEENVGTDVWPNLSCQGRQWSDNKTTGRCGYCTKSSNGVCDFNCSGETFVQNTAKLVQGRFGRPVADAGNRDRWSVARNKEVEVLGQAEDGGVECSRVVGITFLESEREFELGIGPRGNQSVYCLEVAETHNFFANGVLVSNCFKNLYFVTKMSRISGLSNTESQRAFDMFIKFLFVIENGGKVIGMTGTYITNTIAEMFTMQRFLQLLTLKNVNLNQFDAWVRQYALAEPGLEMTPDGSGFRMNTRFRKFVNVPELMQMWQSVADIRRIDPNEIQRPNMFKGKPVKVVTTAGIELENYVGKLAGRAEKIRAGLVEPQEDNMLCVTSDGRKAALDLSLVIPAETGAPMPKIDELTKIVANIWNITKAVKGTQLIFCDLGVPKARKEKEVDGETSPESVNGEETDTEIEKALTTNVYNEIKFRLMKQGVSESEIAYIHSAKNPTQRTDLKKVVNNGDIRVLIGSNEKMGTGLNVQKRLIATHHITPPWRPGDMEQQVGRMWRSGNHFPTVYQFVHVTEKSFDGYIWQLLENKASFIAQITKGSVTDREMEDIGDTVLSYAEIKGLASGNPKIMQKIVLDAEWSRLNSVYSSWKSSVYYLTNDMNRSTLSIKSDQEYIEVLKAAIASRNAGETEEFSIQIKDAFGDGSLRTSTDKKQSGIDLKILAHRAANKVLAVSIDAMAIGIYKGHQIMATAKSKFDEDIQALMYFNIGGRKFEINGEGGEGIILSMNAVLRNLDNKLKKAQDDINAAVANIAKMNLEIEKPWDHVAKFEKVCAELEELNRELQEKDVKQDSAPKWEAKGLSLAGQGITDVKEAIASITEMMALPETISLFSNAIVPAPIEVHIEVESEVVEIIPLSIEKPIAVSNEWRPKNHSAEVVKAVQMALF